MFNRLNFVEFVGDLLNWCYNNALFYIVFATEKEIMPKESQDTLRRGGDFTNKRSRPSARPSALRDRANPHRTRPSHFEQDEQKYQYDRNQNDEFISENQNIFLKNKKLFVILGVVMATAIAAGAVKMIADSGKVQIVNVTPATLAAQQPYQDCNDTETTRFSRNHKSGTTGALIGGGGGALVGGLVSHSWVGVGVGAVVGAVGEIGRAHV